MNFNYVEMTSKVPAKIERNGQRITNEIIHSYN